MEKLTEKIKNSVEVVAFTEGWEGKIFLDGNCNSNSNSLENFFLAVGDN